MLGCRYRGALPLQAQKMRPSPVITRPSKEAFNSAEDQYGEEDRAHRVAWSAVENKYEKNEKGNWVKKDS
jgi:cation transport regulator ChaB